MTSSRLRATELRQFVGLNSWSAALAWNLEGEETLPGPTPELPTVVLDALMPTTQRMVINRQGSRGWEVESHWGPLRRETPPCHRGHRRPACPALDRIEVHDGNPGAPELALRTGGGRERAGCGLGPAAASDDQGDESDEGAGAALKSA